MNRIDDPVRQLLAALVEAGRDSRVARVLAPHERCALTLWVLEEKRTGGASVLLYGWAISSASPQSTKKWVASKGNLDGGVRMARLSTTDTGTIVLGLLEQLLQGQPLGEASVACGIEAPRYGASVRLVGARVARSYRISPVVLLETTDAVLDRATHAVPLRSPNSAAPGFSVSLYLVEKALTWSRESSDPPAEPPFTREVVRAALEHLADETGLDFRGADAARLGNVEFLGFPSANEREEPDVDVRVIARGEGAKKHAESIQVALRPGALATDDEVILRCRQQSGREVVRDDCLLVNGATKPLVFNPIEPLGATTVEIWTRPKGTAGPFSLWFAHRYHWVARSELTMGIKGLSGKIDSDLVKSIRSPKLADRASKLMTFSQVHHEKLISGESEHPWEAATREARELASRLFPVRSGAKFFRKGWDSEGRLSFLEWLLDVAKRTQKGRLVLIDPFFDSIGVEMFARMEQTQLAYAAVTSTQVPSDDDEEGQPHRAGRLAAMCAQFAPVLRRLNFRIYDIRTASKKRRPLHDRYLLLFDGDDTIAGGYQLSNSIQLATRTYPLLVTPIPDDVLEEVATYLQGILGCDKGILGEAKVELLYETPRAAPPVPPVTLTSWDTEVLSLLLLDDALSPAAPGRLQAPPTHDEVAEAAHFAWVDAGRPEGRDVETWREARLLLALQRRGWAVQRMSDVRTKVESDGIQSPGVAALVERLKNANAEEFHHLWSAWGDLCAHSHEDDKANAEVLLGGGEALRRALLHELESATKHPPPSGLAGLPILRDVETLAHHFHRSFLESLDQAAYFITQGSLRVYGIGAWGVRVAITALVDSAPDRLVAMAAAIEIQSKESEGAAKAALVNLLALITQKICERIQRPVPGGLIEALLLCSCDFLRALGARAAPIVLPAETVVAQLRSLEDDIEAVHALAEWASDLRVRANRAGHVESEDLRPARLAAFEEMIRRWPETPPANTAPLRLREVFARVSGPIEGSWARTTVEELLFPLVDRGLISLREVVELVVSSVWDRIDTNLGESPTGGAKRGYQFYASTDQELTDVAASVLARANSDMRAQYVTRFDKQLRGGVRTLRRPFVRSADHRAWASARDGLTWGAAFFGLLWLRGEASGFAETELHELQRVAKATWDVLDEQHVEDRYGDIRTLQGLAEQVRAAVRERIAAKTV